MTGDAVESVTFLVILCMRFRTIFSCFSINYFFAFLAYFVIDALRFRNTAEAAICMISQFCSLDIVCVD